MSPALMAFVANAPTPPSGDARNSTLCASTPWLLAHALHASISCLILLYTAGFLRYCWMLHTVHTVYGLFLQTNAANDQLGSSGTATARAEMLLQRGRTKLELLVQCYLVSYRPLAPGTRADLPSGPSPPQKCQTVARIAAGWSTHFTKPSPASPSASSATRRSCAYVQ